VRLFVAVWPPPEVLDLLAAIERPSVDGVRWTARPSWHVTLRFLGEVDDGDARTAEAVLHEVASRLEPAAAVVGDRVERFGRGVGYVRVDGLRPWATKVAEGFGAAGVGPALDDREFRGHVTVARARGRGTVAAVVGARLPPGPRSWIATEVALVRSRLGSGGPVYTDVAVAAVGPP
jgi:2'-5' RNA ligase